MKNIKLIVLCLFVAFAASCSSITPMQDAFKRNHPITNVPKSVQNSKPDAHFTDEKAIIVSLHYPDELYVGAETYPKEVVREIIERRLEKNPSEKQLIYFNSDANVEYGNVVQTLDIIRRTNAENIGLIVEPATGENKKLQVLKVKYSPEPQPEDTPDLLDKRLIINLQKDGKIKLGRFDEYVFKPTTPEVAEAEIGEKLAPMLKENEEKKINLKGTNETDKTVFIKASRANRYGEVARLVDAAIGAGASEVYLMLDDLD
ncbi:MAG TPA: biopolymer transporter ExbD [Pyrinomonadaceae bacterium]